MHSFFCLTWQLVKYSAQEVDIKSLQIVSMMQKIKVQVELILLI